MSDVTHASPLAEVVRLAGGVEGTYHGRSVIRHFGEPATEYRAAREGAAIFDRGHRVRLGVAGRSPRQMLDGIVTGTMPDAPETASGVHSGKCRYSAVLTPKGKMITDLWVYLLESGDEEDFLLDVPVAGAEGLREHFAKFLPPRLAALRDRSEELGMISVVGPEAPGLLANHALGSLQEPDTLRELGEGSWYASAETASGLVVARTREVEPPAFNVLGPAPALAELWQVLVETGVRPAGLGVWSTLRVEAGRPAYGTDMDEGTIPYEAGIVERAVDHAKGCYTGQEVIVRIRDRGHVNRHLRRLVLGQVRPPAPGMELYAPGGDKPVAWVTSAVESPAHGGVVALAYVRRGVETLLYEGAEIAVPAD